MKKVIIVFLLIVAVIGVTLHLNGKGEQAVDNDYVRIHIRANSNDAGDQQVKLSVRDRVVELLTPKLAYARTKADAMRIIASALPQIIAVSDTQLASLGYPYKANAVLRREEFPLRQYGNLVLESGVYDALVIELGEANGDNWWCVAYPPLCFVPAEGSQQVAYKSKILEIIEEFFS